MNFPEYELFIRNTESGAEQRNIAFTAGPAGLEEALMSLTAMDDTYKESDLPFKAYARNEDTGEVFPARGDYKILWQGVTA